MARSMRKSLAGSAAAAARKVMGGGSDTDSAPIASTATQAPPETRATATKTAPAKKAAVKRTAVKKTAASKATPSRKTAAANGAPTTKAVPAKNGAAKKATPAKNGAATKTAPVKKTTAKKAAPAKRATSATKATPASKSVPTQKSVPAKKAAPAKKATSATNSVPTKKAAPAKRVARPATAASLVVLEGEPSWTKGELKEVVTELREHHERLMALVAESERELVNLMRDAGDGAGHDQADLGATSFERDHELIVVANERDMLMQTELALANIDNGTYGECDSCELPIGKMRLMAFPRATLCLSCKQREERR